MRRTLMIAAAAAASALATAGIAVAYYASSGVQAVSATFTATTPERVDTRTCESSDGKKYEITRGWYSGNATSGNEALNGPVSFHVYSVYNTSDGIGFMQGKVRFQKGDDDRRGSAHFWATNSGGQISGYIVGRVNRHYAALLGSWSANWAKDNKGFENGALGSGSSPVGTVGNVAVLAGKPCDGKRHGNSVRLSVKGDVQSADSTQITVQPFGSQTTVLCKRGPESPSVEGLTAGADVQIECTQSSSDWILKKLKKRD